jgi:formate hydrogenlyase transcriptional activator
LASQCLRGTLYVSLQQTASWIDGAKEKSVLNSAASQPVASSWLTENGPQQLELLLRAIVFQPSTPILITDNDRRYRDASVGASKLLGVPREKIIGRSLDDFAAPEIKPVLPERWEAFLENGEQAGTLQLLGPDGASRDVEYLAKGNVLPVRHLLVLRDKAATAEPNEDPAENPIPSWVQDFALSLLDVDGKIVAWYGGSERIYQYTGNEALHKSASFLNPEENRLEVTLQDDLKRAASEGHFTTEGWHIKKDGTRFWANIITLALQSDAGDLQGYARVVRDFSDRHKRDEKLRRSRNRIRSVPAESTIVGVVSGEFDHIPEANDTFLELIGYSREELHSAQLVWPDLTPREYVGLDEFAHEEGLRFGACTPYEKELIRKDGTRVPVLVATAVLKL